MGLDPKTAVAAAEAAKKLAPKTLRQVDQIGEDLLKTARIILAPIQLTAAWQDRLTAYIERAIRQVPEQRRIAPAESIALPIVEKLRFQEEANPVTSLYINLLSRALDGERVGEAHPAFINIISQMAPDEILFLKDCTRNEMTMVMTPTGRLIYPSAADREERLVQSDLPPELINDARARMFLYESLNQPDLFPVFYEHLSHLGLVTFSNDLKNEGPYKGYNLWTRSFPLNMLFMKLTEFGKLFLQACAD